MELPLDADDIIYARYFLRLLASVDTYFNIALEEHKECLTEMSPAQGEANWRILEVALHDHGLELPEPAMLSVMMGDAMVAKGLGCDIAELASSSSTSSTSDDPDTHSPQQAMHALRVLVRRGPPADLRKRLNPFEPVYASAQVLRNGQPQQPTALYIHNADRLQRARSLHITMLKDFEVKLNRIKQRREEEAKAGAIAQQRKLEAEQQAASLAQQKTELLRNLGEIEARFLADERRIAQLRKGGKR